MSSLTLPVQAGQLPVGFCPPDYQSMLNGFSLQQTVTFPSTFTGVISSATPPTDTTQVWLQLDALGRPVRLYVFAQGAWLSQHPVVPGFIMIWPTALPDFTIFDGGDANAAGTASGPMWQQYTALNAAFPVGAGTLPSTTVIPVGGTGGEEKHTLVVSELAAHTHNTGVINTNLSDATGPTPTLVSVSLVGASPTPTGDGTANGITNTPHNTMPPYVGVLFLQRSNRLFYAV